MLAITGPMRSGTSIVARIAHQLGINMGTHMRMPPPGSGLDPEYEEFYLAEEMAIRALGIPGVAIKEPQFETYIRPHCKPGVHRKWGFKSPLLALYWSEWLEAAESCGEPVVTVLCERELDQCTRSLQRQPHSEKLLEIQASICAALPLPQAFNAVIPFGTPPQQIAAQLATLMGIEHYDPETAVRGIRT